MNKLVATCSLVVVIFLSHHTLLAQSREIPTAAPEEVGMSADKLATC